MNNENKLIFKGFAGLCVIFTFLVLLSLCLGSCALTANRSHAPIVTSTTSSTTAGTSTSQTTDPDVQGTDRTTTTEGSSNDPVTTTAKPTTSTAPGSDEPAVTTTIQTEEPPVLEAPLIQKGDSGDEVKALQKKLVEYGWLNDKADGVFGSKTEKAVRVYQKYASMPETGYAYQSMLDHLYGDQHLIAPVTYDHEDVKDPDYKTDYYIIVYNDNCRVLILGKDDFGKYNVVVKTFICSVGIGGEDESDYTPEGLYSVEKRYDWRTLFASDEDKAQGHKYVYGQYAVRFYGNYLFHSVPYYSQSNDDLKMAEFDKLGSPASLGCVRLCVRDAKWIYDNAVNDTQVRVLNGKNGPEEFEAVPPIINDSAYAGWDPTDPDENNPYRKEEQI